MKSVLLVCENNQKIQFSFELDCERKIVKLSDVHLCKLWGQVEKRLPSEEKRKKEKTILIKNKLINFNKIFKE
jgi:predicted MPP superfamily phosphohydrolase